MNRETLEREIKAGTVTKIEDTTENLKKLHLKHGQQVYGVSVVATDFVEKESMPRPKRGKLFDSKINGQTIIKNAKKNKSRTT